MNQNELIDKITREVMSKLKSAGPTVSGAAASGTAPQSAPSGESSGAAPPDESVVGSAELARFIDHTLLKPEAALEQIDRLCEEAAQYGFYSVCVNSSWVAHCARKLRPTGVKVCAVVGFPLGAMDSRTKAFETRRAT